FHLYGLFLLQSAPNHKSRRLRAIWRVLCTNTGRKTLELKSQERGKGHATSYPRVPGGTHWQRDLLGASADQLAVDPGCTREPRRGRYNEAAGRTGDSLRGDDGGYVRAGAGSAGTHAGYSAEPTGPHCA